MIKEALQKIQSEMTVAKSKPYIAPIASFMMDRVRSHPEDAEKVMVEGKTVAGAIEAMRVEAMKNHAGNSETGYTGYVSDEQGFSIVLAYYGIEVPQTASPVPATVAPAISVTLDDLF